MVTNGSGVAQHAQEIIETCQILWLSLDGPDAATHNASRPGASPRADNFASVESALQTLHDEKARRRRPFPLVMPITVISTYNVDRLPDIYRLASRVSDGHIFYLSWWIDDDAAEAHTSSTASSRSGPRRRSRGTAPR